MKAQEKIYVPIVNLGIEEGEHPAPLWWNKDKKSEHPNVVGTIEYIRKEAILEWARKSKLNTEHANGIGWDDALDELINHIESI